MAALLNASACGGPADTAPVEATRTGNLDGIAAPAESAGFQLYYGPIDADDPDDMTRYTLPPGRESNDCLSMTTPNVDPILYSHYAIKTSRGSHHMVVTCATAPAPDGELSECQSGGSLADVACWLFSTQGQLGTSTTAEFPPRGDDTPPENEGLAFALGARTHVRYNMHFFNATDAPLLRQSWTNVYYADPSDVSQIADQITLTGGVGMKVMPHAKQTVSVSCEVPEDAPGPIRIVDAISHTHAHGRHFRAWAGPAEGPLQLIYESATWQEPLHAYFDSRHANPTFDDRHVNDGALSGPLVLNPGDVVKYECDIENDLETPIRFGNQVFTAEMCNLFGSYAPSMGKAWACMEP